MPEQTNNLAIILQAVKKLSATIQPATKEEATLFWTTLKFKEAIEQISGIGFTDAEICKVLEQEFFENEYIQGVGLVWWVKLVE